MSKKKNRTAITPTRQEDYPEWYQQVIRAADLAEVSPVRGCMVIKPWGYALWENIQRDLDRRFKETGHVNAYFPLFIPMRFLEEEAAHVEGFAKECAVVTHHRLEPGPEGGLVPAGELEEPLIVRPTSETIIGAMFSKWIQSYRDLPLLMNQWANVVRWELRTRLFLRTAEFLWQEGHTAHATAEEAMDETRQMLDVYAAFAQDMMAMPVIKGEKTVTERFPGAVSTFTIEAMMQDTKALQAGTSHFLGQNFAKAQNIRFLDDQGTHRFAWTTSWGVSTRLIGALIMTHSDDDGLVLPPTLAPEHVVIIPIYRNDEQRQEVMAFCETLAQEARTKTFNGAPVRVRLDSSDDRSSNKVWRYIKQGVPIRLEVGPRDVAANSVFMGRRDKGPREKGGIDRDTFIATLPEILGDIQTQLFERARVFRDERTLRVDSEDALKEFFASETAGFASCFAAADDTGYIDRLKALKLTPRCIPVDNNDETGTCIFTGQPDCKRLIIAKAY